jgi:hypothetical protein
MVEIDNTGVDTSPFKFPDSVDVVLGTLNGGAVATLHYADANYIDVQEITGDTGFIIDFVFSGIVNPEAVCFWGFYDGGNVHEVEVMIRNYETTIDNVTHSATNYKCIRSHTSGAATEPGTGVDWEAYWSQEGSGGDAWVTATGYVDGFDDIRAGTSDIPITTTDIFREWPYPVDSSPYVSSGESIVRFLHTSDGTGSHQMFTDKLCIEEHT